MSALHDTHHTLDAVVCGGGIVGAAATLGLLKQGARVHWLRPAQAAEALPAGFAARVYALSPGNLAWLHALGVAPRAERIGSVRAMRIRATHGAGLDLSAEQAGVAEMALIVESDNLLQALESAVATQGEPLCGTALIRGWSMTGPAAGATRSRAPGCRVAGANPDAPGALDLQLDDGSTLSTRLLVAADGAGSALRAMAGIGVSSHAYGHRAVVANFVCEKPHGGMACQWFQGGEQGQAGAVLAWLPLPDQHISMVWSLPETGAEALLALDDATLGAQVAAAGEHRWGAMRLVSRPQAFALRRQRARRLTATRLALVGDAAHVVHPLAGQGMNLGLRDVRALLEATSGRRDPGDAVALARYAALRQFDMHSVEAVTDGLFRLFSQPAGGLLGGHGMGLLNHLAPLKSEMVRQAMR